jgi:hypothetical protein
MKLWQLNQTKHTEDALLIILCYSLVIMLLLLLNGQLKQNQLRKRQQLYANFYELQIQVSLLVIKVHFSILTI